MHSARNFVKQLITAILLAASIGFLYLGIVLVNDPVPVGMTTEQVLGAAIGLLLVSAFAAVGAVLEIAKLVRADARTELQELAAAKAAEARKATRVDQ